MQNLSDLISDWGGFEELVRRLHNTGSVSVERNVKRAGKSGAVRQIDVLIRHKQGLYTYEIIAECKYWNKRVERLHVDALATTIRELGASKGAIFSTKGFQDGAIQQAASDKIDLFVVREPTEEEWGAPGRHIDFWLRVVTMGISRFSVEGAISFQGYEPENNNVVLSLCTEDRTSTPINRSKRKERTLEDLIENFCVDAVSKIQLPGLFRDELGNSIGIARAITLVNMEFKKPMVTLHAGGIVVIPKITFLLGIAVSQDRLEFDRARDAIFALAIEDVVTKTVHASSQWEGEQFAKITHSALDLRI